MRCGRCSATRIARRVPAINTVSVLGVGLIGGSFALALRSAGFRGRILGVSSPATLAKAERLGVIDEGLSIDDAVPASDLVYMAQPVRVILGQLDLVRALAPRRCLVTDAGSTKAVILDRARELFSGEGPAFVGGHPMAGKEGRGVEIAESELLHGATYALVPTGSSLPDTPVVREFRRWLNAMGCHVRVMRASDHDRVVGWTSQMPQLVSTALAAAISGGLHGDGELEVAGDGLRDMTRLAASPYAVWGDILTTNRRPIDEALAAVIEELVALRDALRAGGAESHFERAGALRAKIDRQ